MSVNYIKLGMVIQTLHELIHAFLVILPIFLILRYLGLCITQVFIKLLDVLLVVELLTTLRDFVKVLSKRFIESLSFLD